MYDYRVAFIQVLISTRQSSDAFTSFSSGPESGGRDLGVDRKVGGKL